MDPRVQMERCSDIAGIRGLGDVMAKTVEGGARVFEDRGESEREGGGAREILKFVAEVV